MAYMFLVKKKDEMKSQTIIDLFSLTDNGILINETSNSQVSKNKSLEETRKIFEFYLDAEILEEIEI